MNRRQRLLAWFTDAVRLRKFHGWMTVFWALMMPVALITGWAEVVIYVSVISIYANMGTHFGAWQAARVEVKQVESENP